MKTYAQQQAQQLIETGQCHFPIDWHDVIRAAMRHERFQCAVDRAYRSNPQGAADYRKRNCTQAVPGF